MSDNSDEIVIKFKTENNGEYKLKEVKDGNNTIDISNLQGKPLFTKDKDGNVTKNSETETQVPTDVEKPVEPVQSQPETQEVIPVENQVEQSQTQPEVPSENQVEVPQTQPENQAMSPIVSPQPQVDNEIKKQSEAWLLAKLLMKSKTKKLIIR